MTMHCRYILLTAAKNEEAYIGKVIESVLCQTILPAAWMIMDDGSSDRTAEIVQSYASKNAWIQLQSSGLGSGRNFGSQYKAITAAYELTRYMEFDFVGVHDADITPERGDYYEGILAELKRHPRLGITGGYIYEREGGEWRCRRGNSPDSVAGGIQMFRRECFEEIGGYTPLSLGGSDSLAQIDARIAGWEVFAKPEHHVLHYRPSSSAGGKWRGLFRVGQMDASFGYHPAFQALKCVRQVPARPAVTGGLLRFSGYWWWRISGRKPLLPLEKVAFLRIRQKAKMRNLLRAIVTGKPRQWNALSA